MILEGEIKDAKMTSSSSDFQTLIRISYLAFLSVKDYHYYHY